MDDNEREQFEQQIEEMKDAHNDEVKGLHETIDGQNDRIKELENAIAEIYEIARKF